MSLPGSGSVPGLWPGVWTMGNLGRGASSFLPSFSYALIGVLPHPANSAGYGATTDGMWPYSYDTCDVGTYPSQRDKSGNPDSSASDGWQGADLSQLPGQRLSACTCPDSDHPGPKLKGNTYRGRGVPELDVLEAQVDVGSGTGQVSQSFQIAPFNAFVQFDNSTPATTIYDDTVTHFNSFKGTALQQSVSGVSTVDGVNYNNNGYGTYGFEYWSNPANRPEGYVVWYSQGQQSWRITADSIGPDTVSQVSSRIISEEPMVRYLFIILYPFAPFSPSYSSTSLYVALADLFPGHSARHVTTKQYIVFNLGMSTSWEAPDFSELVFPSKMYIDYVRVYQREDVGQDGATCNPPGYPTTDYINA